MTTTQRMADALLRVQETSLSEYLDAARNTDPPTSYERIARDLHRISGGAIDVSSSTLRNWHATCRSKDVA